MAWPEDSKWLLAATSNGPRPNDESLEERPDTLMCSPGRRPSELVSRGQTLLAINEFLSEDFQEEPVLSQSGHCSITRKRALPDEVDEDQSRTRKLRHNELDVQPASLDQFLLPESAIERIRVFIPAFFQNSGAEGDHHQKDTVIYVDILLDSSQTRRIVLPLREGLVSLEACICDVRVPTGYHHEFESLVVELLFLGFGSPTWLSTDTILLPATANLKPDMVTSTVMHLVPASSGYSQFRESHHAQQQIGFSPMSDFSSPGTFMTAESPASFMTARSTYNSPGVMLNIPAIAEEPAYPNLPAGLAKLSLEYTELLRDRDLLQPYEKELNWSGKGQHVNFAPDEPVPLVWMSHLGASSSALVEQVLCRRVALARKTMRCTRKWTVADALREVYHLQCLRHFHIIQLVGTYLQARSFAILMYPAADCHLGTFLETTADMKHKIEQEAEYWHRRLFLGSTFSCLASAISFVHDNTTKHMDIKPQNILVRRICDPSPNADIYLCWRIYLADFGLSRSFASNDHSQTDGPTARTPKYCAPEVYEHKSRGRAADIFSLGCVYAEIATTYAGHHPHEFAEFRTNDEGDDSYHLNLAEVTQWFDEELIIDFGRWSELCPLKALIHVMLRTKPTDRPRAAIVARVLHYIALVRFSHCGLDPEPYVAHSPFFSSTKNHFQVYFDPDQVGKLDPSPSLPMHRPGIQSQQAIDNWTDAIMSNLENGEVQVLKLNSIFFGADLNRGCYYQPKKLAATWGYTASDLDTTLEKTEDNMEN